MSETGGRSRGGEGIDPNSVPSRISRIMVDSERRRFSLSQTDQGDAGSLPGGIVGAKWGAIIGRAQMGQDRIEQTNLQQLLAMLPDEASRKAALKHGTVRAAKYCMGLADEHMTRTGKTLPQDVWGLVNERVTALIDTLERLEGKPRPPR